MNGAKAFWNILINLGCWCGFFFFLLFLVIQPQGNNLSVGQIRSYLELY